MSTDSNGSNTLFRGTNINTFWIIGMGVAVFIGNWYVNSYRLDQLASDFKDFKAQYATTERLTNTQVTLAAGIEGLKGSISTLVARVDLISDRVVETREKMAVLQSELTNVQRQVEDWRRKQASASPLPVGPTTTR